MEPWISGEQMPIYVYKCDSCSEIKEKIQKFSERTDHLPCEACGKRAKRVVINKTSFALKGSGWYKDHYGLKK